METLFRPWTDALVEAMKGRKIEMLEQRDRLLIDKSLFGFRWINTIEKVFDLPLTTEEDYTRNLVIKGIEYPPTVKDEYWCYLFWAIGTARYKIGYAENVKSRGASIATGSPFPLMLLAVFHNGEDTESWLHRRYAQYRRHGEWFELPEPTVLFLQTVSEFKPEKESEQRRRTA